MKRKIQCFEFEIDRHKDGWWRAKMSTIGVRKGYVRYPGNFRSPDSGIVRCSTRKKMMEYLEYAYGRPLERCE